jgi:hypothetical protein
VITPTLSKFANKKTHSKNRLTKISTFDKNLPNEENPPPLFNVVLLTISASKSAVGNDS